MCHLCALITLMTKSNTHLQRQSDSQTHLPLSGSFSFPTLSPCPPPTTLRSIARFLQLSLFLCSLTHTHTPRTHKHTHTPHTQARMHAHTHTLTKQKSAFWKSLMTNAEMDKMAPHYKAITRISVDVFHSRRPFSFFFSSFRVVGLSMFPHV